MSSTIMTSAERDRISRLLELGNDDDVAELRALQLAVREGDIEARIEMARRNGVVVPEMIRIPAGTDLLGSPPDEEGRWDNEEQIEVTFEKDYWMGSAPVTQAEYRAVMGRNPAHFKEGPDAGNRPVESVSWYDAVEYCNKLSELCGLPPAYIGDRKKGYLWCEGPGFRLPTEVEWEYAARAGCDEARYGELDEIAWYDGNSNGTTHPVRLLKPNAWGLYDTLGNVWEWCWDEYKQKMEVARPDLSAAERPAPQNDLRPFDTTSSTQASQVAPGSAHRPGASSHASDTQIAGTRGENTEARHGESVSRGDIEPAPFSQTTAPRVEQARETDHPASDSRFDCGPTHSGNTHHSDSDSSGVDPFDRSTSAPSGAGSGTEETSPSSGDAVVDGRGTTVQTQASDSSGDDVPLDGTQAEEVTPPRATGRDTHDSVDEAQHTSRPSDRDSGSPGDERPFGDASEEEVRLRRQLSTDVAGTTTSDSVSTSDSDSSGDVPFGATRVEGDTPPTATGRCFVEGCSGGGTTETHPPHQQRVSPNENQASSGDVPGGSDSRDHHDPFEHSTTAAEAESCAADPGGATPSDLSGQTNTRIASTQTSASALPEHNAPFSSDAGTGGTAPTRRDTHVASHGSTRLSHLPSDSPGGDVPFDTAAARATPLAVSARNTSSSRSGTTGGDNLAARALDSESSEDLSRLRGLPVDRSGADVPFTSTGAVSGRDGVRSFEEHPAVPESLSSTIDSAEVPGGCQDRSRDSASHVNDIPFADGTGASSEAGAANGASTLSSLPGSPSSPDSRSGQEGFDPSEADAPFESAMSVAGEPHGGPASGSSSWTVSRLDAAPAVDTSLTDNLAVDSASPDTDPFVGSASQEDRTSGSPVAHEATSLSPDALTGARRGADSDSSGAERPLSSSPSHTGYSEPGTAGALSSSLDGRHSEHTTAHDDGASESPETDDPFVGCAVGCTPMRSGSSTDHTTTTIPSRDPRQTPQRGGVSDSPLDENDVPFGSPGGSATSSAERSRSAAAAGAASELSGGSRAPFGDECAVAQSRPTPVASARPTIHEPPSCPPTMPSDSDSSEDDSPFGAARETTSIDEDRAASRMEESSHSHGGPSHDDQSGAATASRGSVSYVGSDPFAQSGAAAGTTTSGMLSTSAVQQLATAPGVGSSLPRRAFDLPGVNDPFECEPGTAATPSGTVLEGSHDGALPGGAPGAARAPMTPGSGSPGISVPFTDAGAASAERYSSRRDKESSTTPPTIPQGSESQSVEYRRPFEEARPRPQDRTLETPDAPPSRITGATERSDSGSSTGDAPLGRAVVARADFATAASQSSQAEQQGSRAAATLASGSPADRDPFDSTGDASILPSPSGQDTHDDSSLDPTRSGVSTPFDSHEDDVPFGGASPRDPDVVGPTPQRASSLDTTQHSRAVVSAPGATAGFDFYGDDTDPTLSRAAEIVSTRSDATDTQPVSSRSAATGDVGASDTDSGSSEHDHPFVEQLGEDQPFPPQHPSASSSSVSHVEHTARTDGGRLERPLSESPGGDSPFDYSSRPPSPSCDSVSDRSVAAVTTEDKSTTDVLSPRDTSSGQTGRSSLGSGLSAAADPFDTSARVDSSHPTTDSRDPSNDAGEVLASVSRGDRDPLAVSGVEPSGMATPTVATQPTSHTNGASAEPTDPSRETSAFGGGDSDSREDDFPPFGPLSSGADPSGLRTTSGRASSSAATTAPSTCGTEPVSDSSGGDGGPLDVSVAVPTSASTPPGISGSRHDPSTRARATSALDYVSRGDDGPFVSSGAAASGMADCDDTQTTMASPPTGDATTRTSSHCAPQSTTAAGVSESSGGRDPFERASDSPPSTGEGRGSVSTTRRDQRVGDSVPVPQSASRGASRPDSESPEGEGPFDGIPPTVAGVSESAGLGPSTEPGHSAVDSGSESERCGDEPPFCLPDFSPCSAEPSSSQVEASTGRQPSEPRSVGLSESVWCGPLADDGPFGVSGDSMPSVSQTQQTSRMLSMSASEPERDGSTASGGSRDSGSGLLEADRPFDIAGLEVGSSAETSTTTSRGSAADATASAHSGSSGFDSHGGDAPFPSPCRSSDPSAVLPATTVTTQTQDGPGSQQRTASGEDSALPASADPFVRPAIEGRASPPTSSGVDTAAGTAGDLPPLQPTSGSVFPGGDDPFQSGLSALRSPRGVEVSADMSRADSFLSSNREPSGDGATSHVVPHPESTSGPTRRTTTDAGIEASVSQGGDDPFVTHAGSITPPVSSTGIVSESHAETSASRTGTTASSVSGSDFDSSGAADPFGERPSEFAAGPQHSAPSGGGGQDTGTPPRSSAINEQRSASASRDGDYYPFAAADTEITASLPATAPVTSTTACGPAAVASASSGGHDVPFEVRDTEEGEDTTRNAETCASARTSAATIHTSGTAAEASDSQGLDRPFVSGGTNMIPPIRNGEDTAASHHTHDAAEPGTARTSTAPISLSDSMARRLMDHEHEERQLVSASRGDDAPPFDDIQDAAAGAATTQTRASGLEPEEGPRRTSTTSQPSDSASHEVDPHIAQAFEDMFTPGRMGSVTLPAPDPPEGSASATRHTLSTDDGSAQSSAAECTSRATNDGLRGETTTSPFPTKTSSDSELPVEDDQLPFGNGRAQRSGDSASRIMSERNSDPESAAPISGQPATSTASDSESPETAGRCEPDPFDSSSGPFARADVQACADPTTETQARRRYRFEVTTSQPSPSHSSGSDSFEVEGPFVHQVVLSDPHSPAEADSHGEVVSTQQLPASFELVSAPTEEDTDFFPGRETSSIGRSEDTQDLSASNGDSRGSTAETSAENSLSAADHTGTSTTGSESSEVSDPFESSSGSPTASHTQYGDCDVESLEGSTVPSPTSNLEDSVSREDRRPFEQDLLADPAFEHTASVSIGDPRRLPSGSGETGLDFDSLEVEPRPFPAWPSREEAVTSTTSAADMLTGNGSTSANAADTETHSTMPSTPQAFESVEDDFPFGIGPRLQGEDPAPTAAANTSEADHDRDCPGSLTDQLSDSALDEDDAPPFVDTAPSTEMRLPLSGPHASAFDSSGMPPNYLPPGSPFESPVGDIPFGRCPRTPGSPEEHPTSESMAMVTHDESGSDGADAMSRSGSGSRAEADPPFGASREEVDTASTGGSSNNACSELPNEATSSTSEAATSSGSESYIVDEVPPVLPFYARTSRAGAASPAVSLLSQRGTGSNETTSASDDDTDTPASSNSSLPSVSSRPGSGSPGDDIPLIFYLPFDTTPAACSEGRDGASAFERGDTEDGRDETASVSSASPHTRASELAAEEPERPFPQGGACGDPTISTRSDSTSMSAAAVEPTAPPANVGFTAGASESVEQEPHFRFEMFENNTAAALDALEAAGRPFPSGRASPEDRGTSTSQNSGTRTSDGGSSTTPSRQGLRMGTPRTPCTRTSGSGSVEADRPFRPSGATVLAGAPPSTTCDTTSFDQDNDSSQSAFEEGSASEMDSGSESVGPEWLQPSGMVEEEDNDPFGLSLSSPCSSTPPPTTSIATPSDLSSRVVASHAGSRGTAMGIGALPGEFEAGGLPAASDFASSEGATDPRPFDPTGPPHPLSSPNDTAPIPGSPGRSSGASAGRPLASISAPPTAVSPPTTTSKGSASASSGSPDAPFSVEGDAFPTLLPASPTQSSVCFPVGTATSASASHEESSSEGPTCAPRVIPTPSFGEHPSVKFDPTLTASIAATRQTDQGAGVTSDSAWWDEVHDLLQDEERYTTGISRKRFLQTLQSRRGGCRLGDVSVRHARRSGRSSSYTPRGYSGTNIGLRLARPAHTGLKQP